MCEWAKKLVEYEGLLSGEEQNIFFLSYKEHIGSLCSSLSIVKGALDKEKEEKGIPFPLLSAYQQQLQKELESYCNEAINLVEGLLLPIEKDLTSQIFYRRILGAFYRFLCYLEDSPEWKSFKEKALLNYREAKRMASKGLRPSDPARLSVVLNLSHFYCDVMRDPKTAYRIRTVAFNKALPELEDMDEESFREVSFLLQLLRDSLMLWVDLEDSEDSEGSSKE